MSRFTRKLSTRRLKKVIRIYTEGEKTEPNYFNSIRDELRLNEIDIKVRAIRGQTLRLVQDVIKIKKDEHVDEVALTDWWVVFDRDDGSKFNEAIELAGKNGIEVAYSND